MATSIGKLAVTLSADTRGFATGMSNAATFVGKVQRAVGRATDTVRTWEAVTSSVKDFKLAGTETIDSFRTTLAVARNELRRFGHNKDVQVALEIGREYIDESWIRTRNYLQGIARRAGITIAAKIATDKAASVQGWIARQRRAVMKPITVRVELARRALDQAAAATRARLEPLRRYRAIRIGIAAINATKLPAQAALSTLAPIRRLATRGLIIPLRLAHHGLAVGARKARSMLGGLGSFGAGIARSMVSSFAMVGVALAGVAGAVGLGAMVRSGMEAITATKRVADRIGSTTQELSRMQYAAEATGSSVDRMQEGLNEMVQRLGEARTGTGSAADGLKMIGLNADELAAKSPAQAFMEIADAINQLPNQSDRVFAIDEIFGGDGRELINMIQLGSDGISKLGDEADRLGVSFNDVDAIKVVQATAAINRVQGAITGIGQTLAIQLAPYIEHAANWFTQLATSGEGVGAKVIGAFRFVVSSIAYVSDYLSLGVATFKLFQSAATIAIAGVVKAVDYLGQGIVWLLNKIPGVEMEWGSFTGDLATALKDEAGDLFIAAGESMDDFMRGKNQRAVNEWFDNIQNKADKTASEIAAKQAPGPQIVPTVNQEAVRKVKDTLDGIRKDTLRIGLSDSQRKLMDLADDGATQQQIDEAKQLLGLQERVDALSKVGTRNPFGDFSGNIDQLRDLAAQGKITGDQLTAISGTAVTSLADAVKIDGDDALTEYAAVMEQLQHLYAAGKLTADQFATIRAQANTSLTDALTEEAQRITDSVKSPMEAYTAEIERLNELLERGLITQDTFDKAALKARETLSSSAGEMKTDTQGIRAGSQAAARYAYDNARGPARINTQMEYAKASLKEAKDQGKTLDKIARNTAAPAAPQEVEL